MRSTEPAPIACALDSDDFERRVAWIRELPLALTCDRAAAGDV